MALLSWLRRTPPAPPPPAPVRPVEAPVAAQTPTIAIKPTRADTPALARNLERVRVLRTCLMRELLRRRAQPFLDWLEPRPMLRLESVKPKRLARWCDVPTAVLLDGFRALMGMPHPAAGGALKANAMIVEDMAKHAATQPGDPDVRRLVIEHLSELVERERLLGATLGRVETDAEMVAALQAQHRLRKAHRDVVKDAQRRRQPLAPVPGRPGRLMPVELTPEQRAHLDAAFKRRNELLGVR